MNRGDIRAYARRLLSEQTAATSFWSDADLNDYINRSYEGVCVLAELLHCTSLADSVASQGGYGLPSDHLRVLRAWYKDGSGNYQELTHRSPDWLDVENPGWMHQVATTGNLPTHFTQRGQVLQLVPAPFETRVDAVKIWAVQAPTVLSADSDIPEIPQGYHEAIAAGAAIRAFLADTGADHSEQVARAQQLFDRIVGTGEQQPRRRRREPERETAVSQ